MKYWISKYALTRGIFELSGNRIDKNTFVVDGEWRAEFYRKGQWHETKSAACSAAEKMRTKKIASLRKQIERLERMEF